MTVSAPKIDQYTLSHLRELEAESIHIMREVASEFENPVMLYSIGKDSTVMLRLAEKAFSPGKLPFPLMHIDTNWQFAEMCRFRDEYCAKMGHELIVHTNPDGLAQDVNPFTWESTEYNRIMNTTALKQGLSQHGFDAAFGGARRDEEKSRAKERIFSFRDRNHQWDAKNQRPELWNCYNTRVGRGESIRVYPISNWTELDVWLYLWLEQIPLVDLYFAKPRPVVDRDGQWIMVDDERMPLEEGETPEMRTVRFRTLGCYPATAAIDSEADSLESIIEEMLQMRLSERSGRLVDNDQPASMERKKREGYF